MSAPPYSRLDLALAIAGMQLRGWRNSLTRGLSRDPLPAALGLVFGGASALMSLGFGMAAFMVTGFGGGDAGFRFWLVAGLLGSVTIVSALSGASGESGDLAGARMLQTYPVLRQDLLALDVAAQVFAPTVLFFTPATLGVALGVGVAQLAAGRVAAGPIALLGVAAGFLATAVLLRVFAGLVVLGGRRVRETVMVGLTILFLSFVFLGPAASDPRVAGLGREIVGHAGLLLRFTHVGAAADLAAGPSWASALFDVLVLAGWLAGGWLAHVRVTGRILDGDTGRGAPARGAAARARAGRSTLRVGGPVIAACAADFRTMTRLPAVWIQLLMPGVFGLLLGRSSHSAGNAAEAEIAAAWAPVLAAFGAQVFFTSPLFSNLFGSDHAGASHYVLAPVRAWRFLLGKTLSRLGFGTAQVAIFFAAVSFRLGGVEPREIVLAYAAWLAGALWVSAAGAFISIRLPFRMSHGLHREAGNRLLSSLLAQFLVATVLIPPAVMVLGGRAVRGEVGYLAGIAVSALAGGLLWALSAFWCSELWPTWGPRMAEELSAGGRST